MSSGAEPLWRHWSRELPWALIGHVCTVVGVVYVAIATLGYAGIGGCVGGDIVACDAAAYYFTDHGPYAWADAPSGVPPYRYSPAYLWAFAPFRLLNFDGFVWVWAGLHVAALVWLRAGWMLAIPGVNEDVIRGNINVFVAVAIVLAVRYPAAWVFVLLTKVLPGLGVVWHVARREWSAVAVAVGLTAAIIAVGFLVEPGLWIQWFETVGRGADTYQRTELVPLPIRVLVAVAVVAYAGKTSRAWLLPFGILVGWPAWFPPAFMILAAVPRLLERGLRFVRTRD